MLVGTTFTTAVFYKISRQGQKVGARRTRCGNMTRSISSWLIVRRNAEADAHSPPNCRAAGRASSSNKVAAS